MNKKKQILKFIPMIAVMIVIFLFSCKHGDESSEQSGRILEALVRVVESFSKGTLSAEMLAFLHLFIRKVAHFTEYAMLGVATMYAIFDYFKRKYISIPISLIIAAIYATTDEIHQYFVPGRYGTPMDVLIDSCGAITGILIAYFVFIKRNAK